MTIVTNRHSHNSISRAITACLALGVVHVRRQFETVLQDQYPLRRVGPLFEVPGIARDGDQNDPTRNVWQPGRDNLSVHAMRSRNVEVCRIGLCHLATKENLREFRSISLKRKPYLLVSPSHCDRLTRKQRPCYA